MAINEYVALLQNLVKNGETQGKTATVAAVKFQNFDLETLTKTKKSEVQTEVPVKNTYLVMDVDQYPTPADREALIDELCDNYSDKLLNKASNEFDLSKSGFWTVKESSFEEDYTPNAQTEGEFTPNPEAFRICLDVKGDAIGLPCAWDPSFTVEQGGTVAIRAKDIPTLINTLKLIENGEISPTEALLNEDGTAKIDIYGMEPGFKSKNYQQATASQSIQDQINAYTPQPIAQQSATKKLSYEDRNVGYRAGIASYAVGIRDGLIHTEDSAGNFIKSQGIPAHKQENIMDVTGQLSTNLGKTMNHFGSKEYATLSHSPHTGEFIVREFALWQQPVFDLHEDNILHVLNEISYKDLPSAQEALSEIDANLADGNSPIIGEYRANMESEINQKVDDMIHHGALEPHTKTGIIGNISNILPLFKEQSVKTREDLIQEVRGKELSYNRGTVNHVGIEVNPDRLRTQKEMEYSVA